MNNTPKGRCPFAGITGEQGLKSLDGRRVNGVVATMSPDRGSPHVVSVYSNIFRHNDGLLARHEMMLIAS